MPQKRDYRDEYKKFQSSKKAKLDRAARNKARNEAIKKGTVKKGDSKELDHKVPLRSGGSRSTSNTRVRDASANKSDNGHKKGEKHKKHNKGSMKK